MQKYSDTETMQRVWAIEQIKDLMSRRAMFSANEDRALELDTLWVRSPEHQKTASFGRNYGYYVGMDAIRAYYVDAHRERLKTFGSTGFMECHAVSSPYVELAGDGFSARGLWYSIGQETYPDPGKSPQALWVNDKIAADFLLEEDGWKIWHLVLSNDVWVPAGRFISDMPDKLPEEMDWIKKEFGRPTIEMKVHEPLYLWADDYPGIPQPYETIRDTESYGPLGHPGYKIKEEIR